MERKIVLKQDILDELLSVGVSKGQTIMVINRLSAKGTDEVMKPTVFRTISKFVTISSESSVYYRTRGGEWRGCIAATPYGYMVSVVR